jgi:hypothetical protein
MPINIGIKSFLIENQKVNAALLDDAIQSWVEQVFVYSRLGRYNNFASQLELWKRAIGVTDLVGPLGQ